MNAKVLVYAFEPFGMYESNVSKEVIVRLRDRTNITKIVFPVVFDGDLFISKVKELAPSVVIGLGQYPRGNTLRIERTAHNLWRQYKQDTPMKISSNGPDYLRTSLKLKPDNTARYTYDAGKYVCNFSMFTIMDFLNKCAVDVRFAFIHIPKNYDLSQATKFVENKLDELAGDS